MCNLKKLTLAVIISLSWVSLGLAYYPGSPDRNLSVLQTHEITENKHLLTRFNHRFEDPMLPENEHNPVYNWFGLDGSANIYLDAAFGIANIAEVTISRQRTNKIYGLEGKVQLWNQLVDKKPLSLSGTLNLYYKTDRNVDDSDKLSLGLSLIASKKFLKDKLEMIYNGFIQTNTNTEIVTTKPSHSYATGLGVIYRLNRVSLFTEWIIPFEGDIAGIGYVRNNSKFMQAHGFIYRIYNHSFTIIFSNFSDIHAVNFVTGAADESWLHSMKLGFNITRTFKLMH